MPDICDLILDEHETFRRRFAELDDHRAADAETLTRLWALLATTLDRHADAEERLFYPELLHAGAHAEGETEDAIGDHNKIRDAVAEAAECHAGSRRWWQAVERARTQNSDHIAEEERGALADFRRHADADTRNRLGAAFATFNERHGDGRGVDTRDKSPDTYIERHQ